jgi:hypothetical protein
MAKALTIARGCRSVLAGDWGWEDTGASPVAA